MFTVNCFFLQLSHYIQDHGLELRWRINHIPLHMLQVASNQFGNSHCCLFVTDRTRPAIYWISISSIYSEPVSFYCVLVLLFGRMSRKWWICMFELDGDKNRINDTIVYANVTCCHLEWKPAPPYTNMCCCLFDCAETDGLTFQNTQRKHNALLCVISPHFYFTRN